MVSKHLGLSDTKSHTVLFIKIAPKIISKMVKLKITTQKISTLNNTFFVKEEDFGDEVEAKRRCFDDELGMFCFFSFTIISFKSEKTLQLI